MSSNITNQVSYLRTSRNFTNDIDKLVTELGKTYLDIATSVNTRTIGIFPVNVAAVTGESWFIRQNQRQQTLRKVYVFGVIAPGATLTIPHQILSFTQFTKIYGTVVTAVPDYRPLPYVDVVAVTGGISIRVTATDIIITVGTTSTQVNSGLAVLEWLTNP